MRWVLVVLMLGACGTDPGWTRPPECGALTPDVQECGLGPDEWCGFCQDHAAAQDWGDECPVVGQAGGLFCASLMHSPDCDCPE